jgi:chemotaxis protein MotB
MPRKKKKDDEGGVGGAPAYMLTYGDMVTLLLCFFVMLLSMATFEPQKVKVMLSAFAGALGVFEEGPSMTDEQLMSMGVKVGKTLKGVPKVATGKEAFDGRRRVDIGKKMQMVLAKQVRKGGVYVRHEERGIVVQVAESVLFERGSAKIKESAKPFLRRIANILEGVPNHIRVEGHTDDTPIKNKGFPSNWELSALRATSVLRFLISESPTLSLRISCAGYGSRRPVVPNNTPANRARNRRVEIVILREEVATEEEPVAVY